MLYSCRQRSVKWQICPSGKAATQQLMAKIKFGAIVTDIRGSIDSVTYSRSRYGAYARKKVTPVNPNTNRQSDVRAMFGAASSAFRSLGKSTIDAWNAVAPEYQRSNIFGDNLPLSGATLFTKLKTQLINIGVTTNPAAVNPVTIPDVVWDGVVADVSTGTIVLINLPATSAGQKIAVYASPPVSPGKSFFPKSSMRLIGAKDVSGAAGDFDITGNYEDVFGDVLLTAFVGQKIRVACKYVNLENGQAGPMANSDTLIQA